MSDGWSAIRFLADSNENHSEIDTVMRDASYQRERYQLNDPDFLANVGKMKVSYYNGVTESFYTGDKQTLLKTLQEEMKKYDYSLISSELPNGRLSFAMADPEEKDASMMTTWTYPVYGSYLALNDLLVQITIIMTMTAKRKTVTASLNPEKSRIRKSR